VLVPLAGTAAGAAARFVPVRAQSRLQARLEAAGHPADLTPGVLTALGLLLAALLGLSPLAFGALAGVDLSPELALTGVALAVLGSRLPSFWLSRRIGQRKRTIQRELPDALDLIVVSVEAGLGLDAALAKVTERTRGPLATELGHALEDIRLGRSRKQALVDAAARSQVPEFRQFVAAIVQTMEVGGDLGDVLRIQAETARVRRRQHAQEQAMKAPVKMVFPLVLLVFPSLFIVLLAPAALRALEIFG
jgi:tight adherence protein C